jgi:hypothetical protein
MAKPKDDRERLSNLYQSLSESIMSASDKEILEEYQEAGKDPAVVAESMKALLASQIKNYNRQRLVEAQKGVERFREKEDSTFSWASLIGIDKRQLLDSLLQSFPDLKQAPLTLAYRNHKEMTDSDIDGLLDDLRQLGYWKPDASQSK